MQTLKWVAQIFALVLIVFLAADQTTLAASSEQQSDPALPVVANLKDAYIGYNDATHTWEIGTAGIRRRMDYRAYAGFRLSRLTNKLTGREWLAPNSGTSAELQMDLGGQTITGSARDFVLKNYQTRTPADGSLELIVALTHGSMLVRLHYAAFPNTSIIEQWAEIENTGDTPLPDLTRWDSIALGLRPSADPLTLYWVQGLSPSGQQKDTPQPVPTLRLRSIKLDPDITQDVGSQGRSSEDAMGWFALFAPNLREGLFGGIEWSGDWQLQAARVNDQTTLQAGLKNFRHEIAPGEIFTAPRRFIGFYRGDLDDAANRSHAFARAYLLRPRPENFPWTQFNTWFAYYINLDQTVLRREVDAAADLGLEIFYVDAGWYAGSHQHGDFGYGLGTWRENLDKFPDGLAAFADYVHSKGMQFGLWVEPERVDVDAMAHDPSFSFDWLAPVTDLNATPPPGVPRTAQVCLGHPEARAWMKTWLARIIREYKVDWLKWDNNVWQPCDRPGQPGDGDLAHIQGLYEVLDYVRAEFPNLIIEDCASGGNRMDYALMRRTDIAWLSDETDPSYRVRYHVTGAGYPFPSEYLNSWLVESYFEHLADTVTKPDLLRSWLRSRMMGAFGFSVTIKDWSPEFRAIVADEIRNYKNLRPIIANGKRYQLLPQNDLEETLIPPDEPDATEFFDPVTNAGVVFLFKGQIPWTQRKFLFKGLNPNTRYLVTSSDAEITLRQTGRQLMSQNIHLQYADDHPSVILFFTIAP